MKNFKPVFLFALAALFSAGCGGDGPPGPRGPQGEPGVPGEIGFVFEFESVDFTASNDYEVYLSYPDDFEGLDSDVALVYLLWDTQDGLEVWRPLPQTLVTDNGILQYNYDFTKSDVKLFLDGDFPFDELTAMDTDDWVARVVVVPGEFFNASGRMDMSYDAIQNALGLPALAPHKNIASRRP